MGASCLRGTISLQAHEAGSISVQECSSKPLNNTTIKCIDNWTFLQECWFVWRDLLLHIPPRKQSSQLPASPRTQYSYQRTSDNLQDGLKVQNKTRFIYLILTYLSLQVLLDNVGQVPGVGDPVELVWQMDGIHEECLQNAGDFILGVPEIKCFSSSNLTQISTYLNFCWISGLNWL